MKKIIDDIMREAQNEAQCIRYEAQSDANSIIAEAQSDCARMAEHADTQIISDRVRLKKRYEAARVSRRRNILLQAKQDIIEKGINDTFLKLTNVSGAEYDKLILELMSKRMRGGECTIYFPPSFELSKSLESSIRGLAEKSGCTYTISRGRENVKNGFIMVYGGIEENCTFGSLLEENRTALSELAAKTLLGMGESV